MKTTEELKNLLYKNETVADAAPDAIAAAQDFCEGYKTFLDNAKTEREATAYNNRQSIRYFTNSHSCSMTCS